MKEWMVKRNSHKKSTSCLSTCLMRDTKVDDDYDDAADDDDPRIFLAIYLTSPEITWYRF